MTRHPVSTRHHSRPRDRRGLSAGWLLIWSPILLLSVLLITEVGNVFLAKVQLENALESAALAAVDQWRDSGSTNSARVYAVSYAFSNTVSGQSVVLDGNGGGPAPNGNFTCNGEVVLGAVYTPGGTSPMDCSQFILHAGLPPEPAVRDFGVRITKTMNVAPISVSVFGMPLPTFEVTGSASALVGFGGAPRLIHINQFVCN